VATEARSNFFIVGFDFKTLAETQGK